MVDYKIQSYDKRTGKKVGTWNKRYKTKKSATKEIKGLQQLNPNLRFKSMKTKTKPR